MVTAGEFKKGLTFDWNGEAYVVVDFQHVKPGKGKAFVRTKIRNIKTGATVTEAFDPEDKFPRAIVETKEMEYLYNDGELYYFMDATFEQIPLNYAVVADAIKYVKENMTVTIKFLKGEAFYVEAPNTVELLVTECEPAVAGNTATNATKVAIVETGAAVQVPLFVNEGDILSIDTRTGEYLSRRK